MYIFNIDDVPDTVAKSVRRSEIVWSTPRAKFLSKHVLLHKGQHQATASRSRPYVARVHVELDISKKYPKGIWVGFESLGYIQKVELENILFFCNHYKIHDHATNECFILHPKLRKEKAKDIGNNMLLNVPSVDIDDVGINDVNKDGVDPYDVIPNNIPKPLYHFIEDIEEPILIAIINPNLEPSPLLNKKF
ncbi:hypothetical protein IEQ34_005824 [Dendrobium chrysotoxum]|uniref:Uncharacterized protein n=1 Tax=Dendrobium chrysotoxum TaxID=161865 RepID=A0AAV7H9M1_DENCH|nr:hypothetical protein IEQ34_005824 [Dendrobium chrysotoxum]